MGECCSNDSRQESQRTADPPQQQKQQLQQNVADNRLLAKLLQAQWHRPSKQRKVSPHVIECTAKLYGEETGEGRDSDSTHQRPSSPQFDPGQLRQLQINVQGNPLVPDDDDEGLVNHPVLRYISDRSIAKSILKSATRQYPSKRCCFCFDEALTANRRDSSGRKDPTDV